MHNISDFGLTADELALKYEKLGYHPDYRFDYYQVLFSKPDDDDDKAYWAWVVTKLQEEEDDLCKDSPY